jgi:hypothetical protein
MGLVVTGTVESFELNVRILINPNASVPLFYYLSNSTKNYEGGTKIGLFSEEIFVNVTSQGFVCCNCTFSDVKSYAICYYPWTIVPGYPAPYVLSYIMSVLLLLIALCFGVMQFNRGRKIESLGLCWVALFAITRIVLVAIIQGFYDG